MATKPVVDLGDLFGDPAPSTKKGVKTVGTKEASAAAAAASAAKHAKPKVVVTNKGKMAAVGAGAARIMKKSEGAAPAAGKAKAPAPLPKKGAAAKPAKPAKKAAEGDRAGKGGGKFYFAPEDRAAVVKLLGQKVRKPTTTKEFAAANDLPTWQVRLAATDLVEAKKMTLKKDGAALTMSPK